ncbi:MAG: hypothetical protein JJE40_16740, partial [Vicinamibacteria bacterium]|nr:hypothetical protein [Vicinamibacteria bacterium]
MRTKILTGLLLGAFAAACTTQTPATSQPPSTTEGVADTTGQPTMSAPPATTPAAAPTGAGVTPTGSGAEVPSAARGTAPAAPPAPRFREITLPAGTELPLKLESALASDASAVEDPVRASLRRDVVVDEVTVLPAGTDLRGIVTSVQRSGKVKGRASLAFRFTSVTVDDERYDIRTSSVARQAEGTKKKDATKIGIGAGAGAVVGAIVGGGKGAAVGTAVGGGAGTGMVL